MTEPAGASQHTGTEAVGVALCTGASGFTGGHLARTLVARGWKVRALVRRPEVCDGLRRQGIEPVVGEIDDPAAIRRAMEGCTHVFHIAALFREARHPDSEYHRVNVEATRRLVEAARELAVTRFVHCSTAGVHGDVDRVPADETAPYKPHDVYQRTKLEGELVVQRAMENGFPGSIVRPGAIYGPGDLRLLKLFRGIARKRFVMFGPGDNYFHLVYIDDLVDGIVACGTRPEALGETFLLVGPRYVRVDDLVRMVAAAVGAPPPRIRLPLGPLLLAADLCETVCVPLGIEPPLYRRRCDFFCKSRAFDGSKARRLLGWKPVIDVEEGLRRTAIWYRENGLL